MKKRMFGKPIYFWGGLFVVLALLFGLLFNLESVFFDWTKNASALVVVLATVAIPSLILFRGFFRSILPNDSDLVPAILTVLLLVTGIIIQLEMRLLNVVENRKEPADTSDLVWSSDKVMELIGNAEDSLILLQTWMPDAARIGDIIKEKCDSKHSHLKVDIFIINPGLYSCTDGKAMEATDYCAKRFAEINSDNLGCFNDSTRNLVVNSSSKVQVIASIDNLVQRFEKTKHLSINIYLYYDEQPGQKVYIIDNHCLYSVFPRDRGSTSVPANHIIMGVPEQKQDLDNALNEIRTIRQKVYATPYYEKKPYQPGVYPMGRFIFRDQELDLVKEESKVSGK
jgi:hypothetical protein